MDLDKVVSAEAQEELMSKGFRINPEISIENCHDISLFHLNRNLSFLNHFPAKMSFSER